MTLIKSISGIRGTIGGRPNDNLTPLDVVKFASAYGMWIKQKHNIEQATVVLGRDARVSGPMIAQLVTSTLQGMGVNIIDIGLATTPTAEVAVVAYKAHGGIILTASHNPAQWNALKLLNKKGEFISAEDGAWLLENIEKENFTYTTYDKLGSLTQKNAEQLHIDQILELPLVDVEAIAKANFTIAIDCVNSVGGIAIPPLLKALGVTSVIELYCEPNGLFPHNPEPLPEHLTELSATVREKGAHVGFVVDPDVDRLAIISEDGSMFGEEYTLVAVADYILQHTPGNTVSNLSSSRALADVTIGHGGSYAPAAVGEVNVVAKMKATNAVIGGEGNGGVIYPALHYGRDALVGIALFLTYLAKKGIKCSELKASYPQYVISKNKVELTPELDVDKVLEQLQDKYKEFDVDTTDGVKINFEKEWVHLRKSNTEPIIRIYAESNSADSAEELAQKVKDVIREIAK